MYCNMGMTDRVFRMVLGVAIMSQAFVGIQHPLFLLGFFPALIGVTGWCPFFSLVNWSSMTEKEMSQQLNKFKEEEREYSNPPPSKQTAHPSKVA